MTARAPTRGKTRGKQLREARWGSLSWGNIPATLVVYH